VVGFVVIDSYREPAFHGGDGFNIALGVKLGHAACVDDPFVVGAGFLGSTLGRPVSVAETTAACRLPCASDRSFLLAAWSAQG